MKSKQQKKRQESIAIGTLLFVFLLLLVTFFYNKSPYKNLTNQQQTQAAQALDQLILSPQQSKSFLPQTQGTLKNYQRPQIKNYYHPKGLFKLMRASESEEIEKIAKGMSKHFNDNEFNYQSLFEKPVWNLNQWPQNDEEHKLYTNELIIFALSQIEHFHEQQDYGMMRLMVGAIYSLHTIQSGHFVGFDQEERAIITSPQNYNAFQRLKTKSERKPASKSMYALDTEASINSHKKLESHKIRKEESSLNDKAGDDFFDLIDVLISKSFLGVPLFITNPEDFHNQNKEMVKRLIYKIKANPDDYGYTKEDAKKIIDITDLDLSLLYNEISKTRALYTAVTAGGMVALGTILSKIIQKWMVYGAYVITTVGIEMVTLAINTAQGIKEFYILEKYYSFLMAKKLTLQVQGKNYSRWNSKQAIREFEHFASDITYDQEFTIQKRRAWTASIFFGWLFHRFLRTGQVTGATAWANSLISLGPKVVSGVSLSIAFGLLHVVKHTNNSALATSLRTVATRLIHLRKFNVALFLANTFKGGFLAILIAKVTESFRKKTQVKNLKAKSRYEKFPFFKNKIFALGSVLFKSIKTGTISLVDGIITGTILYSVNHWVLRAASFTFNNTHVIPGHSIQIALATKAQNGDSFQEASQKVLYPLCYLTAVSATKATGEELDAVEERISACHKIIMALEGKDFDETTNLLKNASHISEEILTQELSTKSVEKWSNDTAVTSKINEILKLSENYPSSYRTVWTGALRSIFPLTYVHNEFWKTKGVLYLGLNYRSENFSNFGYSLPSSYLINSSELTRLINGQRLIYSLEYFAEKNILESSSKKAEVTTQDQAELLHAKRNLTDEFITYFKFHQEQLKTGATMALKLDEIKEYDFFGNSLDSFLEVMKEQFIYGWNVLTTPFKENHKTKAEEELTILKILFQSI